MKIEKLLKKKLIRKISEDKYLCNSCNNIYSKLGISNHYFYNHEQEGIKKKEDLREKALKNNNNPVMKRKISEKTKEAFKREVVKENFNNYVEKMKVVRKGDGNPMFGKKHSQAWCLNKSEQMKDFKHTEKTKKLLSEINSGKKHKTSSIAKMRIAKIGKKHSRRTKMKMSESHKGRKSYSKLTIEKIKKRYPFFSKIEEMRYNPDKPGEKEIQVHCKNNLCENSKEQGGWFTPKIDRVKDRIYSLEREEGNDGNFFYCSEKCRGNCPLFGLNPNHYLSKNNIQIYNSGEYQTFREEVLKRQKDDYDYNFCEYCYNEENLHVHHEKPQKTHCLMILDPDNGVVLCQDCHYIIGHKTGTECSTGNLASM